MAKRTKARILNEALRLFSRKGIRETTIKDIARAVGVTEGAIYRHFTSKDEIIRGLFEHYTNELSSYINSNIKDKSSKEELLKGIIDAFIDFFDSNPDAYRFVNLYHYLRSEDIENFKELPKDIILNIFNELYKEKKINLEPIYSLCFLVGSLDRLFLFSEIGAIKDDKETIKKKTFDIINKALSGE